MTILGKGFTIDTCHRLILRLILFDNPENEGGSDERQEGKWLSSVYCVVWF